MSQFNLKAILQKPYPSFGTLKSRATFVFVSGIIVFAILFVFRPFRLAELENTQITLYSLGYGLVTSIVTTIFFIFIPLLCPSCFDDSRWNIGKELVYNLLLIVSVSIGNVIFLHFIQGNDLSMDNLLLMCLYTIAIGIFPIGAGLFVKQTILTNRYRKLSNEIKSKAIQPALIESNPISETCKIRQTSTDMVTLTGDNQTDILTLQAESIIYLHTADNYVKIWYLIDGNQKKSALFRSTLSKIESQLDRKCFIRCHRSYLINTKFIEDIIGDAQGLKLIIRHADEVIAVGRSFTADFKLYMNRL